MSSNTRNGWAARREGGCFDREAAKETWGDWWACCPQGTQSYTDDGNNSGCGINGPPKEIPTLCANSTLVLWSDETGYFCCDPDQTGFINDKAWKGCAAPDDLDDIQRNKTLTIADREGRSPASTTSNASSVSSETLTPTTTSGPSSSSASPSSSERSESSQSSTDKGAIAGGVVGGFFGALVIVGMVWLLVRWRRRRATASRPGNTFASSHSTTLHPEPKGHIRTGGDQSMSSELEGHPSQQELPGSPRPRHELP